MDRQSLEIHEKCLLGLLALNGSGVYKKKYLEKSIANFEKHTDLDLSREVSLRAQAANISKYMQDIRRCKGPLVFVFDTLLFRVE